MSRFHNLVAASSAGAVLIGGSALAGPFAPPPSGMILTAIPVNIFQDVSAGYIVPGSYVESTATGRIGLNYCFDSVACVSGYSDAELGADPTITHESGVTGTPSDYPGGGDTATTLDYSVELVDPGNTAAETIGFKANDVLGSTGDGGGLYVLRVTGVTDALSLQGTVGNTATYEGIPEGDPAGVTHISLVPNAIYSVMMEVSTFSGTLTGGSGFAQIDPEFVLPDGSTATLAFSPGITSSAPEPARWALMMLGFRGLGVRLRSTLRGGGGLTARAEDNAKPL